MESTFVQLQDNQESDPDESSVAARSEPCSMRGRPARWGCAIGGHGYGQIEGTPDLHEMESTCRRREGMSEV